MSKWVNADYINDFFDRWEERVKNAEPITIDVVQNVRSILNEAPTIEVSEDCINRAEAIDALDWIPKHKQIGLVEWSIRESDVRGMLRRLPSVVPRQNTVPPMPSVKPSEDLISRQDAIDALVRSSVYAWSAEENQIAHDWALKIISELPAKESDK